MINNRKLVRAAVLAAIMAISTAASAGCSVNNKNDVTPDQVPYNTDNSPGAL